MGCGGRGEGGSGEGTHVNPWLIHVNVWQKPLQYCKVISLQLIKINEKKSLMRKPACSCLPQLYLLSAQTWKQPRFPTVGEWISCGPSR